MAPEWIRALRPAWLGHGLMGELRHGPRHGRRHGLRHGSHVDSGMAPGVAHARTQARTRDRMIRRARDRPGAAAKPGRSRGLPGETITTVRTASTWCGPGASKKRQGKIGRAAGRERTQRAGPGEVRTDE